MEPLDMVNPCPVCGGDPEVCLELDSHEWIPCPRCGADVRPSFAACQDCGLPIGGGPDE